MNAVSERKIARAVEMLEGAAAPDGEAAWAAEARKGARARFLAMGAPARRDEYWKYTDPAPLTTPAEAAGGAAPAEGVFGDVEAAEIVFGADGPRSEIAALSGEGVEALPLDRALGADISFARGLFGALEEAGHEKVARPLAALNTAIAAHGLALHATGAAARPIHLRYAEGAGTLRHVVKVEAGASATLLESGAAANTAMEIELGEGAVLHHVRDQSGQRAPGATHVFARLADGARFKTFTLTSDGALTRNEVVFDLVGNDAVGHAAGGVLATGETVIDNTVFVTHSGLNGESRQVYKSVLDGRGRSVFQGKIFVRPGAQKTDGYQISQSILLSETAEFDAKPELEIYADDVACSHGSTTGAIDEEALFYLRARGVSRREAEAMLVAAFVDEAIEEIEDDALAGAMRARVAAWMAAR